MVIIVRLLIPEKKGVGKRIAEAADSAGGTVQLTRIRRELRGMSEAVVAVSCPHESLRQAIVDSIGRVPGVAILGSETAPSALERGGGR